MNADPFDTLAELLSSLHADKYVLARNFIISTNIQPREVGSLTNTLVNCIVTFISSIRLLVFSVTV